MEKVSSATREIPIEDQNEAPKMVGKPAVAETVTVSPVVRHPREWLEQNFNK